ncbi:hypothetical protein Tfu_1255 [Thermobifida fusca YX]|nr:hypothetical protein Tfu_1255 [Thermobifida fusca YX]
MRGEHQVSADHAVDLFGPSPRAWGARPGTLEVSTLHRTIPTCVGSTPAAERSHGGGEDHPHVRGEHCGLGLQVDLPARTIPTCVGSTPPSPHWGVRKTDHPHVRGEHKMRLAPRIVELGPSPRAWGALPPHSTERNTTRTIPTCVGSTECVWTTFSARSDHPHVRGEHMGGTSSPLTDGGPSPRAWGALVVSATGVD